MQIYKADLVVNNFIARVKDILFTVNAVSEVV